MSEETSNTLVGGAMKMLRERDDRIIALEAKVERLTELVSMIAHQCLTTEPDANFPHITDWNYEMAFDQMVKAARQALAGKEGE